MTKIRKAVSEWGSLILTVVMLYQIFSGFFVRPERVEAVERRVGILEKNFESLQERIDSDRKAFLAALEALKVSNGRIEERIDAIKQRLDSGHK